MIDLKSNPVPVLFRARVARYLASMAPAPCSVSQVLYFGVPDGSARAALVRSILEDFARLGIASEGEMPRARSGPRDPVRGWVASGDLVSAMAGRTGVRRGR